MRPYGAAGTTLYLLRHAKSSWDNSELSDHDRPLAPRGQRAAKVLAEHVRDEGVAPALILCSSSRRTRETLERVLPGRDDAAIEEGLYLASAEVLLERLRAVDEGVGSVLLIGHNPGIGDLAAMLAGGADPALERKFPTGALATFENDGAWAKLGPHTVALTGFVTPKQLAKR